MIQWHETKNEGLISLDIQGEDKLVGKVWKDGKVFVVGLECLDHLEFFRKQEHVENFVKKQYNVK